MATLSTSAKGRLRRIFFIDPNGQRRSIRLGKMPKKQAEVVLRHIENLVAAQLANSTVEAETARWLGGLGSKLRVKLVRAGLASDSAALQPITLEGLIKKFFAVQAVKDSTRA